MKVSELKWYKTWEESGLTLTDWKRYLPELLELIKAFDWIYPMRLPVGIMVSENEYVDSPFTLVDMTKKLVHTMEYFKSARLGSTASILSQRGFDITSLQESSLPPVISFCKGSNALSLLTFYELLQIMQITHDSAGKERKYLPTDLETFFYNPRTGVSWFVKCLESYYTTEIAIRHIDTNLLERLISEIGSAFIPVFFTNLFGCTFESLLPELSRLGQWFPNAVKIMVNCQADRNMSLIKWGHRIHNQYAGAWWVREYLEFLSTGSWGRHASKNLLAPGCDSVMAFLNREAFAAGMQTNYKYAILKNLS